MNEPHAGVAPERVQAELDRFHLFRDRARLGGSAVEQIDPHGFVIWGGSPRSERPYDLVFTALVHGNEAGGLVAINELLETIAADQFSPRLNLVFVLANIDAALCDKRFVERDMNRSFGFADTTALEVRRAGQIEPIIGASRYSFDFHQTIEPTKTPFFVIRYSEGSARFAAAIAPDFPVIVEHDGKFSTNGGMTSHEFAHAKDCTAVSLEIGQLGLDPEAIRIGVTAARRAIEAVEARLAAPSAPATAMPQQKLFSWIHVEPYPDEHIELLPGLANFDVIGNGQVLGYAQANWALTSPVDGILLFPKYWAPGHPRPPEIYRLLGSLTVDRHGVGTVTPLERRA
jgi:succinylglutamate desuccinylase